VIKITITACPPLVTGRKEKEIAKIIIINDGTGTKRRGNYKFAIWLKRRAHSWRTGEIKNFPRMSYNVVNLLWRCLNENFKSKS